MKILKQFLIILSFSFLGEFLHWLLPLPIPTSIYGIILLFIALETKIVKVADIAETSAFLIEVMPIMFIPPAVGLLQSWGMVKDSLVAYVTITVVSTFVVMFVSGSVTQFIIKHSKK